MKLNFGVVDQLYAQPAPARKKGKDTGKTAKATATSTGDVAGWLESEYHIMEIFFEVHKVEITQLLEKALKGAMKNVLAGGPARPIPYSSATPAIEKMFKQFLSNQEMDGLGYPGVPTLASLEGVSHRFAKKHGPERPSFIDTGLYQASFRAWFDEE